MFDVWWNVLVVRVGTLQVRLSRVRLGVIPIQFLFPAPDFVAILVQAKRKLMIQETLSHHQAKLVVKEQLSRHTSQCSPTANKHDGRATNSLPDTFMNS
jgi:hypothetical protein